MSAELDGGGSALDDGMPVDEDLAFRWLEEFERLEDAGFVTVAFVGIRLLVRVIDSTLVPPEWVMVAVIAAVFAWGFSKRTEAEVTGETDTRETRTMVEFIAGSAGVPPRAPGPPPARLACSG